MSTEHFISIEQDSQGPSGGNELPTYDDLATQNGPNSRFGRWKGWIEKRAAERYADVTPEERARRRERGWGNDAFPEIVEQTSITSQPVASSSHLGDQNLHIQTQGLEIKETPPPSQDDLCTLTAPLPFVSQTIASTHLKINHFGSRFLPHTTSQIRCVLPLFADQMLLVGHDEGLSVLDMFPQETTDHGEIITRGPDEAYCRHMWTGETVFQMSILESEEQGSGTPQGVVLAVVGPSQDNESIRNVRMYNLRSLISLAKWSISQKSSRPLSLYKMSNWQVPSTPKKHRAQGSITRGLKSLIDSPPNNNTIEVTHSYQNFLHPTNSYEGPSVARSSTVSELGRSPTIGQNSDESSWDLVEDLPMRWATDFVPLALPGSRLAGASVITFATWSDEHRRGRGSGGQLLAIATKSHIFLYETPKGERAYRFVKEFYTPLQPRNITFVEQCVTDKWSPFDEINSRRFQPHKRSESSASPIMSVSYGTHLGIFVVFDKKAGWIRLADSAVGEIELGEDNGTPPLLRQTLSTSSSISSLRLRDSAAKWIIPVRCDLSTSPRDPDAINESVHVLTRGKRTHIVPCPLPPKLSSSPPLYAIFWKCDPTYVSARIIHSEGEAFDEPPLLQLVAFSENGIEVQEIGMSFLSRKGKGRVYRDEVWRGEEYFGGGGTGFLAVGGNWDQVGEIYGDLSSRRMSMFSMDSVDSTDFILRLKREEGIYGWYQKDVADWRVFWVGGRRGGEDNQKESPNSPYL